MYQIVIGDDDRLFLQQAEEQVRRIMTNYGLIEQMDFALTVYQDPEELKEELLVRPEECQLLLLDVEYGEINGIELARDLRWKLTECSIIYLTFYADFVFECFDTKPLCYRLKPVDWEKMEQLIIKDYRERFLKTLLNLKIGGIPISIPYQEIYALEAVSHRVCLHLKNQKTLEWNGALSKLEQEVSGRCFCKCHNSYLINLEHVGEFSKGEVKMDDGRVFPVSRRFCASSMKQYFALSRE